MKVVKTFVCLLSSIVLFTTVSAQEAAYAVCVACHGADGAGNVALNSPAIAGQESWYLERQLKNFKAGVRGAHRADIYGMQMRPMAMILVDDAAISRVSNYISAMTPVTISNTVEGNVIAGKALYGVCAACHGQDAKGNEVMNSPNLILQQDWYLIRQLQNYKAGLRGVDAKDIYGRQMRPMAMMLANDQAINDIIAYISTLR